MKEGSSYFGLINTVSFIPHNLISVVLNPIANLSIFGGITPLLAL